MNLKPNEVGGADGRQPFAPSAGLLLSGGCLPPLTSPLGDVGKDQCQANWNMEDIPQFLAGIVAIIAFGGFWFLVLRKAGYERGNSAWMAIGLFIPLVNLGILVYFISTTWPIQAELASLRAKTGVGREDDARALMSAAFRLESRGNVSAAIAKYEEVMRGFPATKTAVDAEASIRSLRAKIG